jgi:hypothetical protein
MIVHRDGFFPPLPGRVDRDDLLRRQHATLRPRIERLDVQLQC